MPAPISLWAKKNTAVTIYFPLHDLGDADDELEDTPVTFVAGDVQYSVDGGAFANTSNLPAHEGNGIYSLALVAGEVNGTRNVITIKDQTSPHLWKDQVLLIHDYLDIINTIFTLDIDTVEATAALHSFVTMLLQFVSLTEKSGSNLIIRRTDGTTQHGQRALAFNSSNQPLDSIGVVE